MEKGKIYFIGCGPGDRKLITVKGEETLKKSEIIFYFPPYDEIFYDLIKDKRKYMFFEHTFNEILSIIRNNFSKTIAFLIPGDLSVFSPFSSFLNYYRDRIEVIPGVGTYSYFASKLKKILNPAGKIFAVSVISTKMLDEKIGEYNLNDFINPNTTLIIYMNNLSTEELRKKLSEVYADETPIYIGANLCSEGERIFTGTIANMGEILPKDIVTEKFTTIIVGNIDTMPLNVSWWDNKVKSYKNKLEK